MGEQTGDAKRRAWHKVLGSGFNHGTHGGFEEIFQRLTNSHGHEAPRTTLTAHTKLDCCRRRNPFLYQSELKDAIISLFEKPMTQSSLLSLPTGGGKTGTAAGALVNLLNAGTIRRCVWAAPAKELLDQASATIRRQWSTQGSAGGVVLSACHHGANPEWTTERQILLVTMQKLSRWVSDFGGERLASDCLVIDEAHHVGAPSYCKTISDLKPHTRVLLGLSATPGRSEGKGDIELLRIFGETLLTAPSLGRLPVKSLQERGILSELRFHDIPIDSSIPGVRRDSIRSGGLTAAELAAHPKRFAAVLEMVTAAAEVGRVLVFANDLAHAAAITAVLRSRHLSVDALSGTTEAEHRRSVLSDFSDGKLRALVNVRVLVAGYDLPRLRSVALTTPVKSPITFEQIVGRVTRGPLVGGTDVGHVWQLDNHLKMHGLPTSYHRFNDFGWN